MGGCDCDLKVTGKILSGKLVDRTYVDDAGLDIISNETVIIKAKSSVAISTGLKIKVPDNHVGLIKSRSGNSFKFDLEVGAGVIDSNYLGEIKIKLYNHGSEKYKVAKGDKIAQLLTIPISLCKYKKVKDILNTNRGEAGFGSTGK